ncbi:MAG TPA: two-component regulator propeller domain-containing protein, partial [Chitinophagaceae bacterium]
MFTRISTREGLASDYVYSMLQDKKGFMWLGTANGLQRYDGRKIISFRPHPSDTMFLPAEPISQIMLDKKGRFWVRMARELGLFNHATFEYHSIPLEVPTQDLERSEVKMWEDAEGNVFVTLSTFGIVVYNEKTKSFVYDSTIVDAPRDAYVSMFNQDPVTGDYWIGSSKGLSLYDRNKKKLYDHANNPI